MKTIYLHVGNLKTGTSAIQKFCSEHRSELLEHGYDYLNAARPRGNNSNHGKIPLSLIKKHQGHLPSWYRDPDDFQEVCRKVTEEIDASRCQNILVSSEEFYRFAGYRKETRLSAMADLRKLFSGHSVKVIMYVRDPFDFAKSWYNEVSREGSPRRRFIEFFYFLKKSYLLPGSNAHFWRECFGLDSLKLEPYILSGNDHLTRFMSVIGCNCPAEIPSPIVNPRKSARLLEEDRVRRIMSIKDVRKRDRYLKHHVFSSVNNINTLIRKIDDVNAQFSEFCSRENLDIPASEISLEKLLAYEESVNRGDYSAGVLRLKRVSRIGLRALNDKLKGLIRAIG